MNYQTEQEKFWAGDFGDEYTDRNADQNIVTSNYAFFAKVLSKTIGVNSLLELGANRGLNLLALGGLKPELKMTAVEINKKAAKECSKIPNVNVINQTIFDFASDEQYDITMTRGVLIHINPNKLNEVYDILYKYSKKYIFVSEYYNPTPVEVSYRNNSDKLFKRDFAGELMDRYEELELVDYGFVYHRDNNFPSDDNNWFLLRKGK